MLYLSATPTALNGVERNVDNFRLRQLKHLFQSKGKNAFEGDMLQEFCNKYIIDRSIVKRYVKPLQTVCKTIVLVQFYSL